MKWEQFNIKIAEVVRKVKGKETRSASFTHSFFAEHQLHQYLNQGISPARHTESGVAA